jgi:hypothetical protein
MFKVDGPCPRKIISIRQHSTQNVAVFVIRKLEINAEAQAFYKKLGAANVGRDLWDPPGGGSVPRRSQALQRPRTQSTSRPDGRLDQSTHTGNRYPGNHHPRFVKLFVPRVSNQLTYSGRRA